MATTVARLQAVLSADTRGFDRAMSKSETRMQKVGTAAKIGLGVGVAAGIAVMKRSVRAAIDAEKAQARLEQSFKENVKGGIAPYRQQIEKASEAAINLGFDDEALKDSLGSLVVATKDYGEAQRLSNIAMDIARFKGIDLEQATKMLTMAMAGSQRATKALGIEVPRVTSEYDKLKERFTSVRSEGGKTITTSEQLALKTAKLTDKQRTAAAVIDTVKDKVKGQAKAYKNTAEGEMAVFQEKVENLEEKLGNKLLPTLGKIVDKLIGLIDALDRLDKKMDRIGGITGPNLIDLLKRWRDWTQKLDSDVAALVNGALQKFVDLLDKIVDGFKWIIDHSKKITGVFGAIKGAIPGVGDVDPNLFRRFNLVGPKSISPALYDELAGARQFGLTLTSGYRPGAVTKHGTPSDHGIYPSKAIDVAGPPNRMAGFFQWLIGQRDVKQAFYDPLGSIFGGVLSSYREGGHSDHVHVATYDRGGWLKPGWNLAYNGLGVPEPVGAMGGPQTIVVQLGDTVLAKLVRNAKGRYERNNGQGSF